MTLTKFFIFSFLQWLLLTFLKIAYFKGLVFSGSLGSFLYLVFTAIIVTALARRLGVLNFLEAIFICTIWTVGNLIGDAIFVIPFAGIAMYKTWDYWVGFAVLIFFVFFFHKKRHVEIRHEQTHHHH